MSFIHHGGYALQSCKDIKKLKKLNNGKFIIKDEHSKRNILMNAGTIIDSSNIKIKTLKGKILGTVEESFLNSIKEKETKNICRIMGSSSYNKSLTFMF